MERLILAEAQVEVKQQHHHQTQATQEVLESSF
jgi:hypothetical protein